MLRGRSEFKETGSFLFLVDGKLPILLLKLNPGVVSSFRDWKAVGHAAMNAENDRGRCEG